MQISNCILMYTNMIFMTSTQGEDDISQHTSPECVSACFIAILLRFTVNVPVRFELFLCD